MLNGSEITYTTINTAFYHPKVVCIMRLLSLSYCEVVAGRLSEQDGKL